MNKKQMLKAEPTVICLLKDTKTWEQIFYPGITVGKKEIALTLEGNDNPVPEESFEKALSVATDTLTKMKSNL